MKELTIDQKAKRYDEALERAKIWKDKSGMPKDKQGILDNIFPELAESEDERIRKEIIEYIKTGTYHKNWIAWLEKQHTDPYNGVSFEYNGHTWGMCAREGGVEILIDGELKVFISSEKSFIYPTHPIPELKPKSALEAINEEKVNNQNCVKPVDFKAEHFYVSKVDGKIHDMTYNPADKAEPSKFYPGEWVVRGNVIAQILDVQEQYYVGLDTEGHDFTASRFLSDDKIHLWTIEDAKDGDVLVVPKIDGSEHSEQIFIFKEIKDREYVKNAVEYYCRCVDNEFAANERGFMGQSDDYFTPATKEQRNLLFLKMKEAGYKWNGKELVPIKDTIIN